MQDRGDVENNEQLNQENEEPTFASVKSLTDEEQSAILSKYLAKYRAGAQLEEPKYYDYRSAREALRAINNLNPDAPKYADTVKNEYLRFLRQDSALASAIDRAVKIRGRLVEAIAEQQKIVDEKAPGHVSVPQAEQHNVSGVERVLNQHDKKTKEADEEQKKLVALKTKSSKIRKEIFEMVLLKKELEKAYTVKIHGHEQDISDYNFGYPPFDIKEFQAGTDETQLIKDYKNGLEKDTEGDPRLEVKPEEVKPAKGKDTVKSFRTNAKNSDFNATCLQFKYKTGQVKTVFKVDRTYESYVKPQKYYQQEIIEAAITVVEAHHTATHGKGRMVFKGNWNLTQLEAAVKYCDLMGYAHEIAPGLDSKYRADHTPQLRESNIVGACKALNEKNPEQAPLAPVYRIPEEKPEEKPTPKGKGSWFKRKDKQAEPAASSNTHAPQRDRVIRQQQREAKEEVAATPATNTTTSSSTTRLAQGLDITPASSAGTALPASSGAESKRGAPAIPSTPAPTNSGPSNRRRRGP